MRYFDDSILYKIRKRYEWFNKLYKILINAERDTKIIVELVNKYRGDNTVLDTLNKYFYDIPKRYKPLISFVVRDLRCGAKISDIIQVLEFELGDNFKPILEQIASNPAISRKW